MKFSFAFLLLAGLCVAYVTAESEEVEYAEKRESRWMVLAKMFYKQFCKPEPGQNRCVELTKDTYKNVLKPYRPEIKAKCKEWKAAGQFWLHWPCITLIKSIPKE